MEKSFQKRKLYSKKLLMVFGEINLWREYLKKLSNYPSLVIINLILRELRKKPTEKLLMLALISKLDMEFGEKFENSLFLQKQNYDIYAINCN